MYEYRHKEESKVSLLILLKKKIQYCKYNVFINNDCDDIYKILPMHLVNVFKRTFGRGKEVEDRFLSAVCQWGI